MNELEHVFAVMTPDGKIDKDSSSLSRDETIKRFVESWMIDPRVAKRLNFYRSGVLWQCYEEMDYKIISIPINNLSDDS